MPDETSQPNIEPSPTTPETPISEPDPVPVSPDEPTTEAPVPPLESAPVEMPPEALQASPSPESAIPDKDQNSANEPFESAPVPENMPIPDNPNTTVEKHGNDITITEIMGPTAHSEPATAQMAGNEPLAPASAESSDEAKDKQRKENLKRANAKRQEKKREKINEILDLFAKQTNLTNDEVEKLLHVSDATTTRYLETLEKEGKIKQIGKTGKGVRYEKI